MSRLTLLLPLHRRCPMRRSFSSQPYAIEKTSFKALKPWDNSIYFLNKWSMERQFLHLLWDWGAQLRDFSISCKKMQLKRQFWGRGSRDQPPPVLLHFKTSQKNVLRIWVEGTAHGLAPRCWERIKTLASDVDGEDCVSWCAGRGSFKYVLAAVWLKCLSLHLQLYKRGVAGSQVFETFYFEWRIGTPKITDWTGKRNEGSLRC